MALLTLTAQKLWAFHRFNAHGTRAVGVFFASKYTTRPIIRDVRTSCQNKMRRALG